jgi:hypothetical protein
LKKTFTRPKKTRKDDDLKKTNAEENARSNRKNQCRFRPAATDVITTGTLTDAWPVRPGERWTGMFSTPLSNLTVNFR